MTTALAPLPAFLDVPPRFVLEVASGIKKPADIAAEYGFTPGQWQELSVYPPFVFAVDAKKLELKTEGFSFRVKSAQITEDLLDALYAKAIEEGASFHTTLELAKFTAKAAGLDAPKREDENNGANFSITINLGEKSIKIGKKKDTASEEECLEDVNFSFIPFDATAMFATKEVQQST